MVHYGELPVKTNRRAEWIDITSGVQRIISESKIKDGIVTVSSLHTTAGMTINENADPDVGRDFLNSLFHETRHIIIVKVIPTAT